MITVLLSFLLGDILGQVQLLYNKRTEGSGSFRPIKPQLHIHGFGQGRATVHPDLSNRDASA